MPKIELERRTDWAMPWILVLFSGGIVAASFTLDLGVELRTVVVAISITATCGTLVAIKRSARERAGKSIVWDQHGVRLERGDEVIWALPWYNYGGYRQDAKTGDLALLDREGNPAGVIPVLNASAALNDLQRKLSVHAPTDKIEPIQPAVARAVEKSFQVLMAVHGLTFLGLSILCAWILTEKGRLQENLWLVAAPLFLFFASFVAIAFVRTKKGKTRPMRPRPLPRLIDEWDDPQYAEAEYAYADQDLFLRAVRDTRNAALTFIAVIAMLVMVAYVVAGGENVLPVAHAVAGLMALLGLLMVLSGILAVRRQREMHGFRELRLKRHDANSFHILSDGESWLAEVIEPTHRSPNSLTMGAGAYTMKLRSEDREFLFDPAQLERVEDPSA